MIRLQEEHSGLKADAEQYSSKRCKIEREGINLEKIELKTNSKISNVRRKMGHKM